MPLPTTHARCPRACPCPRQVLKVLRLMGDDKALEVALSKRHRELAVTLATDEVELWRLTVVKPVKMFEPIDFENLNFVQESGGLSKLTSIECVAMGARSSRVLHASAD